MPVERALPPLPRGPNYTITTDQLTRFLHADQCHAAGIDGAGVVVGIVDSGFYPHRFFRINSGEYDQRYGRQGWRLPAWAYPPVVRPDGALRLPLPEVDHDVPGHVRASGHGTGMAANFMAIAPGATLRMYPVQSFIESLETAIAQCQIISISKATNPAGHPNLQQRYRQAFVNGRRNGKVILHAAGNDGSQPWPIMNTPNDLIKIGGIYRDRPGTLNAADYAMAQNGASRVDVCGLCGMRPAGAYIWLPTDPEAQLSRDDWPGWTLASGTSSATPQVAGVCALMWQARANHGMPDLSMSQFRSLLRRSATPVLVGQSADGVAANANWCRLVDAARAVRLAIQ